MIRPALSLAAHAFVGVLARPLYFGPDGQLLDDDAPQDWPLIDAAEPVMTRVADLRLALLSTSIDESVTRAAFEIEGYPPESPLGPVQPRVGDFIALELSPDLHQTYRVELTFEWIQDGVAADIGPGELLVKLHGLWTTQDLDA